MSNEIRRKPEITKAYPYNDISKANSYKVVLLAQLCAFLSTRDCQVFCLRTVSKKKTYTYCLEITFEQKNYK